jgi:hypothetical protein
MIPLNRTFDAVGIWERVPPSVRDIILQRLNWPPVRAFAMFNVAHAFKRVRFDASRRRRTHRFCVAFVSENLSLDLVACGPVAPVSQHLQDAQLKWS